MARAKQANNIKPNEVQNTRKQTGKNTVSAPEFINPDELPDQYALRIIGDCMAPDFPEGEHVACYKNEEPKPGDLVCIYYHPEFVPAGHHPIQLKRLVMAPPPWVSFPWVNHSQSETKPILIVETLNPEKAFAIDCSEILALHKATSVPDNVQLID